jgi:hypothetical protein
MTGKVALLDGARRKACELNQFAEVNFPGRGPGFWPGLRWGLGGRGGAWRMPSDDGAEDGWDRVASGALTRKIGSAVARRL